MFLGPGEIWSHRGLPTVKKSIVTEVTDSDFICMIDKRKIVEVRGFEISDKKSFKEKMIKEKK